MRRVAIRRFTPYQPPDPPAGSYDPALDAQLGASQRGLADLTRDIETAGLRAQDDYGLGVSQANTQYGWQTGDLATDRARSLADLGTGYSRGRADLTTGYTRSSEALNRNTRRTQADLAQQFGRGKTDLASARSRGDEDYQRNVQMLTRQYGQLGRNQLQQANVAGVVRGGALLAAAAKRQENEAIDRQPLDTSHQRFVDDNTQAGQRLGEDYQTTTGRLSEDFDREYGQMGTDYQQSLGRMDEDYGRSAGRVEEDYGQRSQRLGQARDWDLGQLGLGFQRGATDRTTQLTRAQREGQAFGLDVGAQRAYQAAGSGWAPPQRGEPGGMPANEFVSGAGQHYRVINGIRYDQFGRRLGRATGRAF